MAFKHLFTNGPVGIEQTVKQSKQSEKEVQSHNDVWYRHFLKPLLRFQGRHRAKLCQQVYGFGGTFSVSKSSGGISVEQLRDYNVHLPSQFAYYSPILGLLFSSGNLIDNLYRHGSSVGNKDPVVALTQRLFNALPGGQICPTHLARNAAALLTPHWVADLFVYWERNKVRFLELQNQGMAEEAISKLANEILNLSQTHPDYMRALEDMQLDIQSKTRNLERLQQQKEEQNVLDIRTLQGDCIKASRHKIKRLEKELEKERCSNGSNEIRLQQIMQEINALNEIIATAETKVAQLKTQVVSGQDLKQARKALRRAKAFLEEEREDLPKLMDLLARCLLMYEDDHASQPYDSCKEQYYLFPHATCAILLAFLWQKYDDIHVFDNYLKSLRTLETSSNLGVHSERRKKRKWDHQYVQDALVSALVRPDTSREGSCRPPIVPFSYVAWAAYSEFPDCGETALRNWMNQIVYNADSGRFDASLLIELKEKFFPQLHQPLIDFYSQHPDPMDVMDHKVALDWIEVVSHLNGVAKGGFQRRYPIRYRRERQEYNIASPLSNLLRVFAALFGIDTEEAFVVLQVVDRVCELRQWSLHVDTSGIKRDGFGTLALDVGNDLRYELQSYKPVHFGFAQTKGESMNACNRIQAKALGRLVRYCRRKGTQVSLADAHFLELLAISSLFVPYKLKHGTAPALFQRLLPPRVTLLFANLNTASQKKLALEWIESTRSVNSLDKNLIRGMLENIVQSAAVTQTI